MARRIPEKWKILEEINKYSISNYGRIKNNKTGKIKTLGIHNGYYFISFEDYKNKKRLSIHQLVAKYFLSNPYNLKIINHKDCNRLNNRADNLEYCTNFYNTCYKISKQVLNVTTGDKYLSIADAVRSTGIKHIAAVCNGRRKKAGGCEWKFINNIIPKQNISPLKEGDYPLWQEEYQKIQ